MSVFSNLTIELVNIILSYDNVIRFRNGKYIDQIAKNDDRKKMLEQIPMKYEFWWPDGDLISSVVLHISFTKYYAIDYKDYIITIATLQHSGIDYQKMEPEDADESTQLLDVFNIKIK